MVMSKDDFLKYARSSAASRVLQSQGFTGYSENNDGRNETAGINLYGSTESYDESNGESDQDSGTIQYSDASSIGWEQESDRSVQFRNGSGYGSFDGIGNYDLPIRNVRIDDGEYNQRTESGIAGHTTKKRTTLFDKAGKIFGNKLPPKDPIKKQIVTTTIRKVLTIAEVNKNREKLIHLMLLTSEHMDHAISAVTKGHHEIEIWSNLERIDCEILVDAYLAAGQKSARVAVMVRKTIEYSEKAQLGVILVPRIYKSIVYMVKTGISVQLM